MEQKKIFANISRLNEYMDAAGLDALVLRSGQNFTYLTQVVYPGTLARHQDLVDSARAVILLWPRHGTPCIITNKTAAGLARRDAANMDIYLYEGYLESPYDVLTKAVADNGLSTAKIGFEKYYTNAADWERVKTTNPQMEMVACDDLMDRVRWIKTEAEIEQIRKAADMLDDVYLDVFSNIRYGDSERKIHANMIEACLSCGFEWAHGILNSDKNIIPYAGESDFVVRKGDVIRTDYVAYLKSYPGHQSRNVILGRPSALQIADYRRNLEIYREAISRCRAGAIVGDIYEFVMEEFKKSQWSYNSLLIGHGVGPWWHQQEPILKKGSTVRLEKGMVLALEPHKDHWHVQDMILIGEGDPILLSSKFNTDEPYVVG